MPIVETEVEKPAAQGAAMEITVSRQELVKELTATQSVVERKTTIPILSNFLIEAEGTGSTSRPRISTRRSGPARRSR